jgi:AraC family transcriptional regulator, positive regulator of tynA and feaB
VLMAWLQESRPATERWDLGALDGVDGQEGWRESMARLYIPFDARVRPIHSEPFDAHVGRISLGDAALVDYECGRATGRRGRREIAATSDDLVGVLVMLRGSLGLTLNGNSMLVGPGQLVVWDGGRPGSFDALDGIAKRTLVVPRARMRATFPQLERVIGRVLAADYPPVRLFVSYMETVATQADSLDAAARAAAGDAAIELARVALGGGLGDERYRLRDALLVAARRFIDAHLGDSSLTPGRIAAAHAVGLRTLYDAFEPTGESVGGYVRRRRLERCYADLATAAAGSVGEVAARWGFRSSSHFSRVFRDRYGASPREVLLAGTHEGSRTGLHGRSTVPR